MALTDPYAELAEYKQRVGKTTNDDDALLSELLKGVSRLLDQECGRFFTQDAAVVTRLYAGNGQPILYIDDVATATGLIVKVDLDADFLFTGADETLTEGTHFWLGPANADKGPEPKPYRYLEVVPANGRLTVWPEQARAVSVTAKFGWPAIPGAIREAAVFVTREIVDFHKAGPSATLQNIEAAINLSPTAFVIVQRIKREYGLGSPGNLLPWFV
jgi:hypothetical protein